MHARALAAAITGIESLLVRVEVSVGNGLPAISVVGLPQGAVREARDRVQAALGSVGARIPTGRVTVNLAPADVPKEGSAFDLPVAVGLLACQEKVPSDPLDELAFVGELGLDGSLRPVRGALPIARRCRDEGLRGLVVPRENAPEAGVLDRLEVLAASSLREVVAHLRGEERLTRVRVPTSRVLEDLPPDVPDMAEVRGQAAVKRALEVAAAGGHNVLMTGPPGSGKTMLARRFPGILPPMSIHEALEVTAVHSVAGLLPPGEPLVCSRPFRAPHHSISHAGLIGGGPILRPGEVSLAHHGVLFLDELPEFRRDALEALRQPLEDGTVDLARARARARFPARVTLLAAMNPCPCGYFDEPGDRCVCEPGLVGRYRSRISGPLQDRIDVHVRVPGVGMEELGVEGREESSDAIRARVTRARALQHRRMAEVPRLFSNAQMGPALLRRWARLGPDERQLLQEGSDRLHFSARAYHRILRIARTIADLEESANVEAPHLAEAIHYRALVGPSSGAVR